MREGRFEQAAIEGTVSQTDDGWRASTDGRSALSSSLVGACIAVTNDSTSLVLSDVRLADLELDECLRCGVPFVAGSLWIHNADLAVEVPESATGHPDFEEVATVWGPDAGAEYEADTADLDERDHNTITYYKVGRLGHLYFQLDYGPVTWEFVGWFDDPREAAEAVAFTGEGLTVLMDLE